MSFINTLKNKTLKKTEKDNTDDVGTVITDAHQRLEICNACEYMFKFTKQCRRCGCFLPAKTRLEKSRCPLKKW